MVVTGIHSNTLQKHYIEKTIMPTILAMLLASTTSFIISRLPLPIWIEFILASLVWLAVFIITKKLLRDLRP